jgi:hypothetical protein
MNYSFEMGSGVMYTKFHNDLFRHSDVLVGVTNTGAHRQQGDLISLLLFFFKTRKVD